MTDAACVRCGVRRSAASPHVGAIAWPLTLVVVGDELRDVYNVNGVGWLVAIGVARSGR
jgi:hypothetical protein